MGKEGETHEAWPVLALGIQVQFADWGFKVTLLDTTSAIRRTIWDQGLYESTTRQIAGALAPAPGLRAFTIRL